MLLDLSVLLTAWSYSLNVHNLTPNLKKAYELSTIKLYWQREGFKKLKTFLCHVLRPTQKSPPKNSKDATIFYPNYWKNS